MSGTNSYSGGTIVDAGTLVATTSSAIPDGTSLTIGAGGTLIFDPMFIAASHATTATASVMSAATSSALSAATAVAVTTRSTGCPDVAALPTVVGTRRVP